jgi:hypothetical protein
MIVAGLLFSACGSQPPACPPIPTGTHRYLTLPPESLPSPEPVYSSTPAPIVIRGKTILVDRVIEGPLCNDTWSGVVYVTCNVQVYPWVEEPLFLKNCDLSITPDTVVYVAYHNDTAYYKGCSCHTGEIEEP